MPSYVSLDGMAERVWFNASSMFSRGRRPLGTLQLLSVWPLLLMLLSSASVGHAAPINMLVLGDSLNLLTPDYDISWVVQLQNAGAIQPYDFAIDGATSDDVLNLELLFARPFLQSGAVTDSALVVGANEVDDDIAPYIISGVGTPVIHTASKVEAVIDAIAAANPGVHQVVATIPDVTLTPRYAGFIQQHSLTPIQVDAVQAAIMDANDEITQYALAHGVAVVDLFGASQAILPQYPWTFGGHTFNTAFDSNGFDVVTQVEGLISNLMAMAFNQAFGRNLPMFSDQEIVTTAGFTPNTDNTYYDISPFVLLPVPEPATLTLAAMGALTLLAMCRHGRSKHRRA